MNYNAIFYAILSLAGALITYALIPWLKAKLGTETFNKALKWASIAVKAAEMIYNESGMGEKKKEYVETFMLTTLEKLHITLTPEELNNIIEAAVDDLHNAAKGA